MPNTIKPLTPTQRRLKHMERYRKALRQAKQAEYEATIWRDTAAACLELAERARKQERAARRAKKNL